MGEFVYLMDEYNPSEIMWGLSANILSNQSKGIFEHPFWTKRLRVHE
jgi:hypothetical protein